MCCSINKFMPTYKNTTFCTSLFLLNRIFPNEIFPENTVQEEMIGMFFKNEFHKQINTFGETGLKWAK